MIEIAKYTTNATGVLPTFNSGYTGYTVDEIDNGDGTYNVEITTDSSDILPTAISFAGKTGLLKVDYLNVSAVTNMASMFNGCSQLTSLDLSGWDTSKVTTMTSMFSGCSQLITIYLFNSSASTINDFIYYLPTKTSVTPGEIFISDIVSISYVDVTSANIKDWSVVIVTDSIDGDVIKKVYYCYMTVSKVSIGSKTIKHIYTYTIKE